MLLDWIDNLKLLEHDPESNVLGKFPLSIRRVLIEQVSTFLVSQIFNVGPVTGLGGSGMSAISSVSGIHSIPSSNLGGGNNATTLNSSNSSLFNNVNNSSVSSRTNSNATANISMIKELPPTSTFSLNQVGSSALSNPGTNPNSTSLPLVSDPFSMLLGSSFHIAWMMEVIGQGFLLPIEDMLIINNCINIYSVWLLEPGKRPQSFNELGKKQKFYQSIFRHLSLIFQSRKDSPVVGFSATTSSRVPISSNMLSSNSTALRHVDLCKSVLKLMLNASKVLGSDFSSETWIVLLKVILGISDWLLKEPISNSISISNNNSNSSNSMNSSLISIPDELAEIVLSTLFEIWLRSGLENFSSSAPSMGQVDSSFINSAIKVELWASLKKLYSKWLHRTSTVNQWSAAAYSLTHRLTKVLYSDSINSSSSGPPSPPAPSNPKLATLSSDLASSLPVDFLMYTWHRIIYLNGTKASWIISSGGAQNLIHIVIGLGRVIDLFLYYVEEGENDGKTNVIKHNDLTTSNNISFKDHPPTANTLLDMFGDFLFECATLSLGEFNAVNRDAIEVARAESLATLCRFFSHERVRGQRIASQLYLVNFYHSLSLGLDYNPSNVNININSNTANATNNVNGNNSILSLVSIIIHGNELFKCPNLEGIVLLYGDFVKGLRVILQQKTFYGMNVFPDPMSTGVNIVNSSNLASVLNFFKPGNWDEVRLHCYRLLKTLICLPNYYDDLEVTFESASVIDSSVLWKKISREIYEHDHSKPGATQHSVAPVAAPPVVMNQIRIRECKKHVLLILLESLLTEGNPTFSKLLFNIVFVFTLSDWRETSKLPGLLLELVQEMIMTYYSSISNNVNGGANSGGNSSLSFGWEIILAALDLIGPSKLIFLSKCIIKHSVNELKSLVRHLCIFTDTLLFVLLNSPASSNGEVRLLIKSAINCIVTWTLAAGDSFYENDDNAGSAGGDQQLMTSIADNGEEVVETNASSSSSTNNSMIYTLVLSTLCKATFSSLSSTSSSSSTNNKHQNQQQQVNPSFSRFLLVLSDLSQSFGMNSLNLNTIHALNSLPPNIISNTSSASSNSNTSSITFRKPKKPFYSANTTTNANTGNSGAFSSAPSSTNTSGASILQQRFFSTGNHSILTNSEFMSRMVVEKGRSVNTSINSSINKKSNSSTNNRSIQLVAELGLRRIIQLLGVGSKSNSNSSSGKSCLELDKIKRYLSSNDSTENGKISFFMLDKRVLLGIFEERCCTTGTTTGKRMEELRVSISIRSIIGRNGWEMKLMLGSRGKQQKAISTTMDESTRKKTSDMIALVMDKLAQFNNNNESNNASSNFRYISLFDLEKFKKSDVFNGANSGANSGSNNDNLLTCTIPSIRNWTIQSPVNTSTSNSNSNSNNNNVHSYLPMLEEECSRLIETERSFLIKQLNERKVVNVANVDVDTDTVDANVDGESSVSCSIRAVPPLPVPHDEGKGRLFLTHFGLLPTISSGNNKKRMLLKTTSNTAAINTPSTGNNTNNNLTGIIPIPLTEKLVAELEHLDLNLGERLYLSVSIIRLSNPMVCVECNDEGGCAFDWIVSRIAEFVNSTSHQGYFGRYNNVNSNSNNTNESSSCCGIEAFKFPYFSNSEVEVVFHVPQLLMPLLQTDNNDEPHSLLDQMASKFLCHDNVAIIYNDTRENGEEVFDTNKKSSPLSSSSLPDSRWISQWIQKIGLSHLYLSLIVVTPIIMKRKKNKSHSNSNSNSNNNNYLYWVQTFSKSTTNNTVASMPPISSSSSTTIFNLFGPFGDGILVDSSVLPNLLLVLSINLAADNSLSGVDTNVALVEDDIIDDNSINGSGSAGSNNHLLFVHPITRRMHYLEHLYSSYFLNSYNSNNSNNNVDSNCFLKQLFDL